METAALLVVLAAAGGILVVRSVFSDERRAPSQASPEPAGDPEREAVPAAERRPRPARAGSRRLLTTAALSDTLALEGEEELRTSFFGRTLAFARLLLVILFICALAGGTLFWLAMMIASKAHLHPG